MTTADTLFFRSIDRDGKLVFFTDRNQFQRANRHTDSVTFAFLNIDFKKGIHDYSLLIYLFRLMLKMSRFRDCVLQTGRQEHSCPQRGKLKPLNLTFRFYLPRLTPSLKRNHLHLEEISITIDNISTETDSYCMQWTDLRKGFHGIQGYHSRSRTGGIFAALTLADLGIEPVLVIEKGKDLSDRRRGKSQDMLCGWGGAGRTVTAS
jgi:hypothetical protein